MKNFFLISAIALFALLLFSFDSGAEEEFTISVDPGWMDEKERNCKTITANVGNSTEDGTYEVIVTIEGFVRGMSLHKDYLFIGLSKLSLWPLYVLGQFS